MLYRSARSDVMQIRQLRYFLKVAEMGSITAAAKELRMTQPALSRQIRAFEEETGWGLLDRGAKSIRLTRAGQVVVNEGKAMVVVVDQGLARMQREIEGGVIRIGYAPSLAGQLLKRSMSCYIQRHPRVRIDLVDSTSEEMRKKILTSEVDLIVGAKLDDSDMEWEILLEKHLCLAVPKTHEWGKKRSISSNLLDGKRVLLLSRHEYPEYFKGVSRFFRELGINAKVAGEFDGIESLCVALEAGIGIALVAEGSSMGQNVNLLKIKPTATPVEVAVGWRGDRALDSMTAAFVEELRQAARA
ncbi:MAG: DNA-binding transcriptional LysR family regulator [Crocinitomicaceae bacterium]|jgi:DNA-binding transcriptional LysR family regulator